VVRLASNNDPPMHRMLQNIPSDFSHNKPFEARWSSSNI